MGTSTNARVTAIVTLIGAGLLGCTGSIDDFFGDSYRGGAALDGPEKTLLFVARPTGYRMRRIVAPYDATSTELYASDEGLNGVGEFGTISSGPRLFVEPGGSRMVISGIGFPLQDGWIFDISQSGPTSIMPSGDSSTFLDATFGPNLPWMIVQDIDYTIRLLRGPPSPGGAWIQVAGTTVSNCIPAGIALAVDGAGDPTIYCGGKTMTVGSGADLVVDTAGSIAFSFAADGVRTTTGDAEFFFLSAAEGGITNLQRRVRNPLGPGWVDQPLAQIPGGAYEGSHEIIAAGPDSVAVIQRTCEEFDDLSTCSGQLHAAWLEGTTWVVETVGPVSKGEGIEGLSAAGSPPTIMTGSITLMLHRRSPTGTWSTEELGALGQKVDNGSGGCAVSGDRGSPVKSVVLAAMFAVAGLAFARRVRARHRAVRE